MKTIVLYNRPLGWFNPITKFSFFEPIISYNNVVSETTNESSTGYSMEYSMPEFRKKDLSIKVDKGFLKVQAKSKSNSSRWVKRNKSSYENHYLREICITDDMDAEKISAKFRNGKLTIDIPRKKEYVNFREIKVDGLPEISEAKEINESSHQNIFVSFRHKIEKFFRKAA